MIEQIENIQRLATALVAAKAAHDRAVAELQLVRQTNGQHGYSVTVNGVSVAVAENGGRESGWASKLIRGREMIHLGAIKALQAVVDNHAHKVKQIEELLKKCAAELSP